MKIIEVNLSDLKPYEKNPRINDESIPLVENSIRQFGFLVPLVIDRDNTIVSGHTRYLAAKNIGMSAVPCVLADELTPAQIKAFRIADNKVAERSKWNYDLLSKEMFDITELDFNLSDFGFTSFDIDFMNRSLGIKNEPEEEEENPDKPVPFGSARFEMRKQANNEEANSDVPKDNKWLQKGLEYSEQAMSKKRVVIEYDEEDEGLIKDLLREEGNLKSFYRASEISQRLLAYR